MATTFGSPYTTFHSIDALLGGQEASVYGHEYLKRFPVDGKGRLDNTVYIKPQRVFEHGSQANNQSDAMLETKRDTGNSPLSGICFVFEVDVCLWV